MKVSQKARETHRNQKEKEQKERDRLQTATLYIVEPLNFGIHTSKGNCFCMIQLSVAQSMFNRSMVHTMSKRLV